MRKLEGFSRKYYTKAFIRGVLLFVALGGLIILGLLGLEYFLWLGTTGRLLLLIGGVLLLLYLFVWQIGFPLLYLFRLRKGISPKEASRIIGKHFPNVGDKLYNLLDLAESNERTELLLASIAQRSSKLAPIPFSGAIDLRENRKYLKYVLIPLFILAIFWITGQLTDFLRSYQRVVNYDVAYQPPAPFSFILLSDREELLEHESYELQVTTQGSIQPEEVYVVMNGKEYLLQERNGIFEYSLVPPIEDISFYFKGGEVNSGTYKIKALKVPLIEEFEMSLKFPSYLNLNPKTIKGTGNAVIPEGTRVSWLIRGKNTDLVSWSSRDTTMHFGKEGDVYQHQKVVYRDTEYQITTSNANVADFESLAYRIETVPDAYPTIKVSQARDSLNPNLAHYAGVLQDDHGISDLRLVCYPSGQEEGKKVIQLDSGKDALQQFYYTFPEGLEVGEDQVYEYYFEVVDNDGLRGGKTTKSMTFSSTIYNKNAREEQRLELQEELIRNMDNSVDRFKEQQKKLEELRQEQKEKTSLNFNDKREISDFLKRRQEQEGMMEKFSRQLKENLEQNTEENPLNELLKERLERQELEAERNRKLLEQLEKVADKIKKEELSKRLEELGKKQQSSQRSLEQLLELTKRYYVTEKAAQLAAKLEELGKDQEQKGEQKDWTSKEEQKELNERFKELKKELDTLQKDNQGLKKPMDLKRNKAKEESITRQQEEISKEIEEQRESSEDQNINDSENQSGGQNEIKKQQQRTGQRIKELSDNLQQAMAGAAGGSSIAEDAEMLRQILDNLITFSFKQEQLFEQMQSSDPELGQFAQGIRGEQQLRQMFEHVDDSLFALSLRRAELSEVVNEQITEVYYNIDKSLESIAENRIYQGVSYQQYVLAAANELADLLADILDNMQQSLSSGSGQGQGSDFQLQDIIMSQEQLQKQMQGMGEGKGKQESGDKPKEGEGDREGKGTGEGQEDSERGKGKEGQKGSSQDNKGSKEGPGMSEEELKDLYDIYKQQEEIRQQLEKQLKDMISKEDQDLAKRILRQMQQFQSDLLENGITKRTNDRLAAIQYQLLKLKDAEVKQGNQKQRESTSAKRSFENPLRKGDMTTPQNTRQIEILNRQALPLRQNYQKKVQRYFNNND